MSPKEVFMMKIPKGASKMNMAFALKSKAKKQQEGQSHCQKITGCVIEKSLVKIASLNRECKFLWV
jgi:hypothetical protein